MNVRKLKALMDRPETQATIVGNYPACNPLPDLPTSARTVHVPA